MQKVSIKKKIVSNGKEEQILYYIPSLSLKNSDNKVKLLVPHPNGNDIMEFSTIEEAAASIRKAGFEYSLPDGEIISEEIVQKSITQPKTNDIGKVLFNKFKSKVNDINSSIVSSAISALSYLNDSNAIDIFIDKLGEDNEKIRSSAIDALANYQGIVIDKLIDTLTSTNWVARNSAIACLVKISEYADVEPEKILVPLINRLDDENTIVQASAILASGKIYRNLLKRQEK